MEDLDLYGVKITDAGVEHLRKMTALRRLNLLGGQITDASAEILAQFHELRDLNLYRSRITNAGLAKLQSLKKLEMLDLRYSGVTNAGVQAFRAAVPDCKVTYVDAAPRVPISKTAAPPAGAGEPAIAQWLEALGGQVRMAGGRIQSISLARVAFDDAQLKHLGETHGAREVESRRNRRQRPGPRNGRETRQPARPESQLHFDFGPRPGRISRRSRTCAA